MPVYPRSAITAKQGVNYIRSIVENAGSIFHKIEQENDLGIDGVIELIENGSALNKQAAVQIKSGSSYYNDDTKQCTIPVDHHREYWLNYPLPVLGIVYVPKIGIAYWVNIKSFLQINKSDNAIKFQANRINAITTDSFLKIFFPLMCHRTPSLTFDEAQVLARSPILDEKHTGLSVQFHLYPNDLRTWDEIIQNILNNSTELINPILVYWLAHIPWHGDIGYSGECLTTNTKEYAKALIARFGINEFIKLLKFVDPEESIGRGTLGQSVEAIISSVPNHIVILREICKLTEVGMAIREIAALIIAMEIGENALPVLSVLVDEGSDYAGELKSYILEFGGINPYL